MVIKRRRSPRAVGIPAWVVEVMYSFLRSFVSKDIFVRIALVF